MSVTAWLATSARTITTSDHHHHHLVCDTCGLLIPFDDEHLELRSTGSSEPLRLRDQGSRSHAPRHLPRVPDGIRTSRGGLAMQDHAQRLDGLGTTIFTEMTALAERTGAINLGQGFPDTDGPVRGGGGRRRRAARRRQPVRAAAGRAGAARGGVRAPARALRARARGGADHVRRDRGDRVGAARALRPRRRGDRARAVLRLLRGLHRLCRSRSGVR